MRRASLALVAREWTRLGITGFGGPPVHIALLRELVVNREGWLDGEVFEDAIAACSMLPGPTSTQLAIYCAYRVAGPAGAVIGGLGFVLPAVLAVLALSVVFLAQNPPLWVRGAGAGAGAVVAVVAVRAGSGLVGPSWRRLRQRASQTWPRARWLAYLAAGAAGAIAVGPYLVLVLLGAGACELFFSSRRHGAAVALLASSAKPRRAGGIAAALATVKATGGVGALAWTSFKVGALAFGGGFVVIPLMQGDAVHIHHWMTNSQFLNAVALGQVTPGPVVATVAAVGYAAGGLGGGLLAALVAFLPSFAFVLIAGNRFERLRGDRRARAFLDGAGPAAIGAIFGAAVTLAAALSEAWQAVFLAVAALLLLVARRGIVPTLLAAGVAGAIGVLLGLPAP